MQFGAEGPILAATATVDALAGPAVCESCMLKAPDGWPGECAQIIARLLARTPLAVRKMESVSILRKDDAGPAVRDCRPDFLGGHCRAVLSQRFELLTDRPFRQAFPELPSVFNPIDPDSSKFRSIELLRHFDPERVKARFRIIVMASFWDWFGSDWFGLVWFGLVTRGRSLYSGFYRTHCRSDSIARVAFYSAV